MGYTQVNSSSGEEGELKGPLFNGTHSPDGVFGSLKGSALTPPELSYDVQDSNLGPDRLNQEVADVEWVTNGPIMSGTYDPDALTRGTDKHMPK
jgi:hypothetical protein